MAEIVASAVVPEVAKEMAKSVKKATDVELPVPVDDDFMQKLINMPADEKERIRNVLWPEKSIEPDEEKQVDEEIIEGEMPEELLESTPTLNQAVDMTEPHDVDDAFENYFFGAIVGIGASLGIKRLFGM